MPVLAGARGKSGWAAMNVNFTFSQYTCSYKHWHTFLFSVQAKRKHYQSSMTHPSLMKTLKGVYKTGGAVCLGMGYSLGKVQRARFSPGD